MKLTGAALEVTLLSAQGLNLLPTAHFVKMDQWARMCGVCACMRVSEREQEEGKLVGKDECGLAQPCLLRLFLLSFLPG